MSGVAACFSLLGLVTTSIVVGVAVGGPAGIVAGIAVAPAIIGLVCLTLIRNDPGYGPAAAILDTAGLVLAVSAWLLS